MNYDGLGDNSDEITIMCEGVKGEKGKYLEKTNPEIKEVIFCT